MGGLRHYAGHTGADVVAITGLEVVARNVPTQGLGHHVLLSDITVTIYDKHSGYCIGSQGLWQASRVTLEIAGA